MENAALQPWSTTAINLPEHAGNPIHTDAGESWLTGGGGELRLKLAVLNEQQVDCVIGDAGGDTPPIVEATVGGEVRATFELWKQASPPPMRSGDELLPAVEFELTPQWCDYGVRSGDDLALYTELGVGHPAMWPSLANDIFVRHLVDGSWIHTRSRIWHQGLARVGQQLTMRSTVVDRFESRAGERAVVDIEMFADGAPVARLEHEALVRLF